MTGYVTRTDGLSLCSDCANWSGPYSGCLVKTNNTTNCHVQTCDSYSKNDVGGTLTVKNSINGESIITVFHGVSAQNAPHLKKADNAVEEV